MPKNWIRLFNLISRSDLEQSLNKMINEYDVTEIKVWNDSDDWWNALVRYYYKTSPIEEQKEPYCNFCGSPDNGKKCARSFICDNPPKE